MCTYYLSDSVHNTRRRIKKRISLLEQHISFITTMLHIKITHFLFRIRSKYISHIILIELLTRNFIRV